MSKHTLYRGTPYSGLELDDLKGRGGHGQEMLGRGLYCTDEYYVEVPIMHRVTMLVFMS